MGKLLQTAPGKKWGVGHGYLVQLHRETIEQLERIFAMQERPDLPIQAYLRRIIESYANATDPAQPKDTGE